MNKEQIKAAAKKANQKSDSWADALLDKLKDSPYSAVIILLVVGLFFLLGVVLV